MTTTGFPTLPPVADSLESAIALLEQELDDRYRQSLRQTTETRSGIVHKKRVGEISIDIARKEAVARALSRVLGYRQSETQLLNASYERINGRAIVDAEDERVKELA